MKIAYKNWKCSICNNVFDTRRLLENHKKEHIKPCNWECTICKEKFESRKLRREHRKIHSVHIIKKSKFSGYHPIINANCKYCGKICKTNSSLKFHEKCCNKNPNRIIYKGHPLNEKAKNKLSNSMKLAIKEGRAHGWANVKQNKNGMSYPEIWFEKVIENEFEDKNYEYNKQFFKYKLDFAWSDKKKCIEIDGQQHNLPERKQSDENKDKLLNENGWLVLRLSWSYICNNTKEAIKIAKDFIASSNLA